MPPRLRIAAIAGMAFLLAVPALAAQQAGVAAAVRADVQIAERSGAVGRQAKSGEPVFLGNAIASGPGSGMQIILLDETTFTIGPNSRITIDQFVYDPSTSVGKVAASITKGAFRFVTGKIAKRNPGAMEVKLPTGTIGIRGTAGLGLIDELLKDGRLLNRQQVVLLGPGPDTDSDTKGGLDLFLGNLITSLIRSGWGSTLLGDGPWSPPERFDPALIAQLLAALSTTLQPPVPPWSGDSLANAGQSLFDLRGSAEYAAWFERLRQFTDLIDNRFTQDSRLPTGQYHYGSFSNALFSPVTGTQINSASFSVFLNIDFGHRTIGGGTSGIDITLPVAPGFPGINLNGTAFLPLQSLASSVSPGSFQFSTTNHNFGAGCTNCRFDLLTTLLNINGVAAQGAQFALTASQSGGVFATGSGTTTTRFPGTAPAP